MELKLLLAGMCDSIPSMRISGLALNSKYVRKGDAFIAMQGTKLCGVDYINSAARKGAIVALVEQRPNVEVAIPVVVIPKLREKLGKIAAQFYGEPTKKLIVIGVTGTNGKSSTCFILAHLLEKLGKKTGVITTNGIGFIGNLKSVGNTTPDPITIQEQAANMLAQGAACLVMEVSSHALIQKRVKGVSFDITVFLNLSIDHLDYHGSMTAYGAAKKLLFTSFDNINCVINKDDSFARSELLELPNKNIKTFSIDREADLMAVQPAMSCHGIFSVIKTKTKTTELTSNLQGRYNLENLLAALSCLELLGYSIHQCREYCRDIVLPEGRFQIINKNPMIIVDYAHTPDALRKVLVTIQGFTSGRVWCIFGCGGNRDKDKRQMMAKVAERHSDTVIVTEDNPRNEDPNRIIDDICRGFSSLQSISFIRDRKEAIYYACGIASKNDTILIAGKGHERVQIKGNISYPFSDVEVAKQAVLERNRSCQEQV